VASHIFYKGMQLWTNMSFITKSILA